MFGSTKGSLVFLFSFSIQARNICRPSRAVSTRGLMSMCFIHAREVSASALYQGLCGIREEIIRTCKSHDWRRKGEIEMVRYLRRNKP